MWPCLWMWFILTPGDNCWGYAGELLIKLAMALAIPLPYSYLFLKDTIVQIQLIIPQENI